MPGPEVVRGDFDIEMLLSFINNATVKERLRRYAPRHFAVLVSRDARVLAVLRSKESIDSTLIADVAKAESPEGASWFLAEPGMYSSAKSLQEKVNNCASALDVAPGRSRREMRIIDGKKTLLLRSDARGPDDD